MAQFDWVDFYKAFAKALLQYKDKRSGLIEIIKKVYEEIEINLPVYYSENVPLFRRNGYRKSGTMILRVRSRDTALK